MCVCVTRLHSTTHTTSGTDYEFGIAFVCAKLNNNIVVVVAVVVAVEATVSRYTKQENTQCVFWFKFCISLI